MLAEKKQAEKLMVWASRASTSVALILVVTKFYAWLVSNSVAMLGSTMDSGLDLMASLVTLFAVKTAIQPPDEDHRFGHGKAEALASLFQGAVMGGAAVFILFESVRSFFGAGPKGGTELVMGISGFAIILSLFLVMFQSYVIRKSASLAISGDHLHYKGDLLLNASVVLSAWLVAQGVPYSDSIFGLLIAVYILYGAYEVIVPSIHMLMDRELSDADRDEIIRLTQSVSGVKDMHDLRTRASGRDLFIQMHVDVDAHMTVSEGHKIADSVEMLLAEHYTDAEILIHIDAFIADDSH